MSYFSRTFNTNNGILDRNLFSVDKYVLYNFLDCVFYVLSIEDIEYSFASPKNIIFADNDTKIRVFLISPLFKLAYITVRAWKKIENIH